MPELGDEQIAEVRADLLRRSGRDAEAVSAYDAALTAGPSEPERHFLLGRRTALAEVL